MPSKSEPFSFAEILKSIDVGQNLTSELAQRGLMSILEGDVDDKDLESFLVSLNKKRTNTSRGHRFCKGNEGIMR